jgi:hypothetical protein
LNIEEIEGIFPQDKFDVAFYANECKEPIFHIENNDIDMVFRIVDGCFLKHNLEVKDKETVAYVLENFNKWYDENKKNHCYDTWFYLMYEWIHHREFLKTYDELPFKLTNMDIRIYWANKRTAVIPKLKINNYDFEGNPFEYSKFDVTVYELTENGDSRFHIENNEADLVFSIDDCKFLYRASQTLDKKVEDYILDNVDLWYCKRGEILKSLWESTHIDDSHIKQFDIYK